MRTYTISSVRLKPRIAYKIAVFLHSEVGHVYSCTFYECTQMYVYVRLHTTMYDILRYDVQQCTTMYANVRQKILPYDRIFVAPKCFKPKTHLSSATQRSKSVSNSHCSSVLLPQQAAAKFYRQKGRIVFKIVFLKITSMWPKKSNRIA